MAALEEVTRDELQGIVTQLKEALYNHQTWHSGLMRTLTCGLPADKRDIQSNAHSECRFGQWYEGQSPEKLRTHPGFIAMGEEHQRMHHMARLLLLAAGDGRSITPLEYDNFANSLERLRLEIFALERELEDSLLNRDTLTGAITRYGILPTLREQVELVKRHAHHCYIAMIDLDNFKVINDLYGHGAGDRVLTESARYLMRHLRPYDKVFRYGGEEFLLCMPYTHVEAGEKRINELNAGLAALEINIGSQKPLHVTASFGLALLDPEVPVEASIDRADRALYAAKAAGKNCVRMWDATMEGAGS